MTKELNIQKLADVKEFLNMLNNTDIINDNTEITVVKHESYYNDIESTFCQIVKCGFIQCGFNNNGTTYEIECSTELGKDDTKTMYHCNVAGIVPNSFCILEKKYRYADTNYYIKRKSGEQFLEITEKQAVDCFKYLLLGDFDTLYSYLENMKYPQTKFNLTFE